MKKFLPHLWFVLFITTFFVLTGRHSPQSKLYGFAHDLHMEFDKEGAEKQWHDHVEMSQGTKTQTVEQYQKERQEMEALHAKQAAERKAKGDEFLRNLGIDPETGDYSSNSSTHDPDYGAGDRDF